MHLHVVCHSWYEAVINFFIFIFCRWRLHHSLGWLAQFLRRRKPQWLSLFLKWDKQDKTCGTPSTGRFYWVLNRRNVSIRDQTRDSRCNYWRGLAVRTTAFPHRRRREGILCTYVWTTNLSVQCVRLTCLFSKHKTHGYVVLMVLLCHKKGYPGASFGCRPGEKPRREARWTVSKLYVQGVITPRVYRSLRLRHIMVCSWRI